MKEELSSVLSGDEDLSTDQYLVYINLYFLPCLFALCSFVKSSFTLKCVQISIVTVVQRIIYLFLKACFIRQFCVAVHILSL